ncbi:DUF4251 domain-containing protein [Prevotella sp. 10(H)]|uniref:DUF4251 domain-containing protein n=1 Tax=Prevotella sp. 10(H) TaxID=1158294 RepID=UPI0004A75AAC|nr:DUF4251 domain-containing protein [Prevotella sp. 10(H)]
MKKIIFTFITAMLISAGCKTQQDPAKAAAEQAEQKLWADKAVQALNDREFVLEADRIDFKYGRFVYVNASTNFISMHDNKATIQMAFNSPYAGPNGIGGITVDGTVSGVKMETDKKGNITFEMMVQGVGVSANVILQMTAGTNQCRATVSPNFNSNRINFTGNLYPEEESNVYKGRAL